MSAAKPSPGESQYVQWTKRHGITDFLEVDADDRPDWNDDATKGAALGLVRILWHDPEMHVIPASDGRWCVWPGRSAYEHVKHVAAGDTEGEALHAAIERAP